MSLLKIDGFSQGIGGSYNFLNNSVSSKDSLSSTQHDFTEDYTLAGDFSILSKHLVKGSASLDLFADQERQTDQTRQTFSSSNLNLGYRLSSVILDRSPFPVSVSADSLRQTTSAPFSRTYDVNSDDLNVSLAIANEFLPVRFGVQTNSSVTSGLADDRRQHSDYYLLNLQHVDGSFSTTNLAAHQSGSQSSLLASGVSTTSSEVGAALTNSLTWQDERHLSRTLSTSYSFEKSGGFFSSTSQVASSNLAADLGKSLSSTASYSYSANSTDLQSFRMQTGNLTLSHRLADSITTTLTGSGSSTAFNDGSESNYGGGGNVSYVKQNPWDGVFSSSYGLFYSVTDRERSAADVPVENERHDIPPLDPKQIVLANRNFQQESVTVRGAQSLILYTRDLDYQLIPEGILIIPGHMTQDSQLLISYSYLHAPQLTFASVGQTATVKLDLFNKMLLFYGDYRLTEMQLLKGTATADELAPASHLDLGCEANFEHQSVHAEYGRDEYFATKLDYLDGRWLNQRPFASGTLALSANDHLTFYHQGVSSGVGNWENGFGVNGNYSRNFGEKLSGRLMLGYLNLQNGGGLSSNLFTGNLNLEAHLGKTLIALVSSLSSGFGAGVYSQSESVGLSFRRNF